MGIRILTFLTFALAAFRVTWFSRRLPLDQLIERLRQVPVLPEPYRNPEAFQETVNRWYGLFPPRGMRSCLKQSYLLLDLWTRCGLHPEFHLGVRTAEGLKEGHAWLTVENLECSDVMHDYEEAFVA